jgi:cytochrome P450
MTQSESQTAREPPTPAGLPIIGNLVGLVKKPFDTFPRWQNEYGDAIRTQLGTDNFYIFYHPDRVKQVLVDDDALFDKGKIQRKLFEPITGTPSVSLSTDETWKQQRRGFQSAFNADKLADYLEVIAERTSTWVESQSDGNTLSIGDEMISLTLEILAEVFLGVDATAADDPFRQACIATTEKYDGSPSNYLLPDWLPTAANRQFDQSIDASDTAMRSLIRQRNSTDGNDALSVLIAQNERSEGPFLSEESINNNLIGFLLAGHQSLGVALTYLWHLLATHPDVAERARDEIERELGNERLTVDDLAQLDYVNAVITEALRYYPPIHVILRDAEEDTTVGGYSVPEGSVVMLPQFVIHRDERWFDAPNQFDPGRWLGDTRERPDFAYFPFGGGPHRCYVRQLCLAYLKTVVATVARGVAFDAETQSFGQLASLTSQPDREIKLVVKRL